MAFKERAAARLDKAHTQEPRKQTNKQTQKKTPKKQTGARCLLTTKRISEPVAFDSNVGCQQSSHPKRRRQHPGLERLARSFSAAVLFLAAARLRAGRGQSRHFRGHGQICASARGCGSAADNHPDVSNQLASHSLFPQTSFWRANKKTPKQKCDERKRFLPESCKSLLAPCFMAA